MVSKAWTASAAATLILGAAVFFVGPSSADSSIQYRISYEGPRDLAAVKPLLLAKLVGAPDSGYGYGYGYGYGDGHAPQEPTPGDHGYGYGYGYGDGPHFGNLPPGNYRVLGFADLGLDRDPSEHEPQAYGTDTAGRSLFHLSSGEAVSVSILVEEAGSNVTGRVVATDGSPIAGATVALTDRFGWPLERTTDEDGRFLIPDAPTGISYDLPYAVRVNAAGFVGFESNATYAVTRGAFDLGTLTLERSGDTTRPTVVAHAPQGDGVSTDSKITIAFSEPMDRSTILDAIRVEPALSSAPHLTWENEAVTLSTDTLLFDGTTYSVRVTDGAKDVAGNPLEPFAWTFSTGTQVTTPTIIGYGPTGEQAAPGRAITVTFSETMDQTSVEAAIEVTPPLSAPVKAEWNGNTIELRGHTALLQAKTYSVVVRGSARDAEDTPLAGDFAWSFTTAPAASDPRVLNYWPIGLEEPMDTTVGITFAKPMDPMSVRHALSISPLPAWPVNVRWDGNTMVLSGTRIWIESTTFTVTLNGSARAADGSKFGEDLSWTFTTAATRLPAGPDTTGPTIVDHDPVGDRVYAGARIAIRFSEAMDHASAQDAVRITPALAGPVRMTWIGPGNILAIQGADMTAGTTYHVVIDRSAMDRAGNALAGDNEWTFTTASARTPRGQ